MKIIDNKGRLFGIINVVDLLIVVLVFAIVPAFFYTYKIMLKAPVPVRSEWVKVKAVSFLIPEIEDLFTEGDVSRDQNGMIDGKLLKWRIKDSEYGKKIDDIIKIESRSWMIPVMLEMELLCSRGSSGERWYYKRAPLIVSLENSFSFVTDRYSIICFLLKIEGQGAAHEQ